MSGPAHRDLPDGFTVRPARGCRRRGRHIVGGSPLRRLTLSDEAVAAFSPADTVTVVDERTREIARRLLDAGVADPLGARDPGPTVTVVVPVHGNQAGIDRLLGLLTDEQVVVVDDASPVPITVPEVAGVRLLRLPHNAGPAAARNAGAELATTDLVAFLDSDTAPHPGWVARCAWHFADPAVALVAPRIVGIGRPPWRSPVAVYAARHSSLDMGPRPALVAPGRPVSYVPSAALLVRREAFVAAGGFDPGLRVAEDVDLCWRMVAAGWGERYEPSARVAHDHRRGLRALFGRRRFYGTGAAELARLHGSAAAPVVTSVLGAVAAVGTLSRTRIGTVLAAAVYGWMFLRLRSVLRGVPGRNRVAAWKVFRAAWFGTLQGWSALLRHYWPIAVVALPLPAFRRRLLAAAVLEAAATWGMQIVTEPGARHPDPLSWALLHRLDDLMYGAGVWQGALAHRDIAALRPVITRW